MSKYNLPPRPLGMPGTPESLPAAPQQQAGFIGRPVEEDQVEISGINTSPSFENGELEKVQDILNRITTSYSKHVVGQEKLKTSLLVALLTGGHVLLESVPGLAKTTAAQTLASTVSADFKRIQCTPDLLPSDIIGTQIYDQKTGTFNTQLGPVHSNFVLLDEINRSSSKTQSAMLEAMQERQTSIGGKNYDLPDPFLVIATQNPIEQEGTYHLPEAQLDRFLLKEVLTYSTPEEELEILRRIDEGVLTHDSLKHEAGVASIEEVKFLQKLTSKVYIDQSIRSYIVNLIHATRNIAQILPKFKNYVEYGASPRASIAFLQASKAIALLNGRAHVIPDDVKALKHEILRHRLILNYQAEAENITAEQIIDEIFQITSTP